MTVYSYTGAAQTHTVGAGVVAVLIECKGAAGSGTNRGKGSTVSGLFLVTPGDVLNVYVGGQAVGTVGGYNGGGNGKVTGGGGGGASDVRIGGTALTDRKIVAGGGNGNDPFVGVAGNGGFPNGGNNGGTQTAGGTGFGSSTGQGSNGALGVGGNGPTGAYDAGGGGGGYYGGGGGGRTFGFGSTYGSSGGGSSFIGDIATISDLAPYGPLVEGAVPVTTQTYGTHDGDGEVTITEYTAAAFGVVATGGTITDLDRYRYHVLTASADFVPSVGGMIEAWLIGGGGGGGSSSNSYVQAGGAGAGGVLHLKGVVLAAGTYPAVIGAAGAIGAYPADGTQGGNTTFLGFTAFGGAKGNRSGPGAVGGSGAGGGNSTAPGAAQPRQGYSGGYSGGSNTYGGGGGGAGGVGNTGANGKGGPGITVFGTVYAAGGRGSNTVTDTTGYGNPGSGGRSTLGPSATAGQPGVLVIRYLLPFTIVEADLSIDPVLDTTVTIVPPKTTVIAELTVDPEVSTSVLIRQQKQARLKRTLVWVNGLDGVRRNVID